MMLRSRCHRSFKVPTIGSPDNSFSPFASPRSQPTSSSSGIPTSIILSCTMGCGRAQMLCQQILFTGIVEGAVDCFDRFANLPQELLCPLHQAKEYIQTARNRIHLLPSTTLVSEDHVSEEEHCQSNPSADKLQTVCNLHNRHSPTTCSTDISSDIPL